jgi:hypothetical protein
VLESKLKKSIRQLRVELAEELLPSMLEALDSIPSTAKNKYMHT